MSVIAIVLAAAAEPTLVQQWTPVVAPIAALAGVWFGKRLEHGGATEAWLRDRRAAVFADLVHNAHQTWHAVRDAWREPDVGRWRERMATWTGHLTALAQLVTEVELLGPDDVVNPAMAVLESHEAIGQQLDHEMGAVDADACLRQRLSTGFHDTPLGAAAHDALDAFVQAAKPVVRLSRA